MNGGCVLNTLNYVQNTELGYSGLSVLGANAAVSVFLRVNAAKVGDAWGGVATRLILPTIAESDAIRREVLRAQR